MAEPSQRRSFLNRWGVDFALLGLWISGAGTAFSEANQNQPAGIAYSMAIGWLLIATILKLRNAEQWERLAASASCATALVGIVLQGVGWWL